MATPSQDRNTPYRSDMSVPVPVAAKAQRPAGAMPGVKMAQGAINGKAPAGRLSAVGANVAVDHGEGKQGERGIPARCLDTCCRPNDDGRTPALLGQRTRIVGRRLGLRTRIVARRLGQRVRIVGRRKGATDDGGALALGGH